MIIQITYTVAPRAEESDEQVEEFLFALTHALGEHYPDADSLVGVTFRGVLEQDAISVTSDSDSAPEANQAISDIASLAARVRAAPRAPIRQPKHDEIPERGPDL